MRNSSVFLMYVTRHTRSVPSLTCAQFSDLNAFLTLAATRHTLLPDDLRENVRINQIISAAKAGRVPVQLVSSELLQRAHFCKGIDVYIDLSEKNPLQVLPDSANMLDLLKLFSLGTHRGQSSSHST
jgi:hypothetical protein